jgi:hypothetical protein
MGFGDRDDRGSVGAHLKAKAEARETRQDNARMKQLEAEDEMKKSDGILLKVVKFLKVL